MPKVGKRKAIEIYGFRNIYRIPDTRAEVTFVQRRDANITSVLGDGVGWEKSVGEAQCGEFFAGLLNIIDAPLSELESALDESKSYYKAKTEVCIINSDNVAIPKIRFYLIQGLLKIDEIREGIDCSFLDLKLKKEDGYDFDSNEYNLMAGHLHKIIQRECKIRGLEPVKENTIKKRYLMGDGLYPWEWHYFDIFSQINPDFFEFTKGWSKVKTQENGNSIERIDIKEDSNAFWYHTYINKRRRLIKWLRQFKREGMGALREHREAKIRRIFGGDYSGAHDITPELQVLFERWDGKESQQINVQLVKKIPLTRDRFEAEMKRDNKKKRIRIVENKAPSYPRYRRYQEMPLCCVNTLLTNIARYSILEYLASEFDRRLLPHCWVRELTDLVLYKDGIKTPLTREIMKIVMRCEQFANGSAVTFGNRIPIENKFYELDAVAESVRHYISVGDVGRKLGLSPGDFIAFYNTLKRVTMTLPNDYWDMCKQGYKVTTRSIGQISSAPRVKVEKGEIPSQAELDEIMQSQSKFFEQDRARLRDRYAQSIKTFKKSMIRVYGGKKHVTYVLPWNFIFEPIGLGIRASECERLDILRILSTPGVLTGIVSDRVRWGALSVERYSQEQVSEIFSNLRIPKSVESLIPPENYVKPQVGFTRVRIPTRSTYSTRMEQLIGVREYV